LSDVACIPITELLCQLANTSAVYVGSRVQEDEWKIVRTQYTLHSHAEGTGFGNCKQEGLPTEF